MELCCIDRSVLTASVFDDDTIGAGDRDNRRLSVRERHAEECHRQDPRALKPHGSRCTVKSGPRAAVFRMATAFWFTAANGWLEGEVPVELIDLDLMAVVTAASHARDKISD
jgi:hypothetical protein